MKIFIVPTAEAAELAAASLVIDRLKAKPNLVLGCATGRTMEGVYDELVRRSQLESLDFSRVSTFNLDEYVGLDASDERSYHHYMHEKLFSRVNIQASNTHLPNGTAADPAAEAASFEARISAVGGIDLQLLGLGNTGHIGFNEPLSSLRSRTRQVALTPQTREQNSGMFGGDADKVPATSLTMGVETILEAREVLLVVTGEHKAAILARATEGPVSAMVSATALQFHPNCRVIADEAAAAQLTGSDYCRAAFQLD